MNATKLYQTAYDLHREEFVPQALELYTEVLERFPESTEAENSKCRIRDIQEAISTSKNDPTARGFRLSDFVLAIIVGTIIVLLIRGLFKIEIYGWSGLAVAASLGCLFYHIPPFRPRHSCTKRPREYHEREYDIEEAAKRMFIKMHGNQGDERWTIDQINGLPWYDEGAWLRLLYEPRVRTNQDLKLGVFVSAAKAAATGPRHDKTIMLLRQALGIDPHNLVVNCKLAEAFERIGSGQEAISAYESALKDLRKTPCLKKYVSSQIKRVKANGPIR